MKALRSVARLLPASSRHLGPRISALPQLHQQTRNLSLLPRLPHGEFSSLFRLLDDYENHFANRGQFGLPPGAFTPRFDMKETPDAYQLDGELPGISQQDVEIEFTDPHTLVVKGRTERQYSSGSDDGAEPNRNDAVPQSSENIQEGSQETTAVQPAGRHRYWVSERSVGEFHRAFTFPGTVDQENVKASLKDGILSITVPKAPAPGSKKINIE